MLLAKIQHEGIQRDVAATLAHFSANGDMQVDVFPADIFLTVFDLAYSEEQLTARYAIMAICNLAVVGMNQVLLQVGLRTSHRPSQKYLRVLALRIPVMIQLSTH